MRGVERCLNRDTGNGRGYMTMASETMVHATYPGPSPVQNKEGACVY
jgi:hypothetical protein